MLWTLIGPTWKFPCVSEPTSGTDILQVTLPQIPTLKRQKQVVSEFLTASSVNQNEQGWFMIQNELAKVALLSEGLDPEDCVSWTPPLEGEKAEDQFQGMNTFFENLSSAGWGTVPALKTFYFKFCMAMLEQLVFRGESVDLVWGKLHSVPMRANWKQVLMEIEMTDAESRKRPPLKSAGREDRLMDNRLQAIESGKTFLSRQIEVELGTLYHQNNRAAQQRKIRQGKLRRTAHELKRKSDTILALYSYFLRESSLPYVLFRDGRLPESPPDAWAGNSLIIRSLPDLPMAFGAEPESVSEDMEASSEDLYAMPSLLREGSDMRDTESDVAETDVLASSSG